VKEQGMTEKQFSVWLMGHIRLTIFPAQDQGYNLVDVQKFADEVLEAARCVSQTQVDEILKGGKVCQ
jgi:hypothetical protein